MNSKIASSTPHPVRTVLVTGAAGALGSTILKRFSQENIQLIAFDRSTGDSNELTPHSELPDARLLRVELADPQSVRNAFRTLDEAGVRVDGLAHCAGGFRYAEIENTSDEDIDFLVNANLKSSFYLLREVLPRMKKSGFGRIALVSSLATQKPSGGVSVYAATKAGLNLLVGTLQEEVKAFDINLNAVLPSIIDTPANRKDMGAKDAEKWVPTEELAEVILNLMQPWGRSIRGSLVPLAGRV